MTSWLLNHTDGWSDGYEVEIVNRFGDPGESPAWGVDAMVAAETPQEAERRALDWTADNLDYPVDGTVRAEALGGTAFEDGSKHLVRVTRAGRGRGE